MASNIDAVSKDIAVLRDEISRLNKVVSAQSAEAYHDLRSKTANAVESVKPLAKNASGFVKSEAVALSDAVRQHPTGAGTVVVLASAVGLLAGYLLGAASEQQTSRRWW